LTLQYLILEVPCQRSSLKTIDKDPHPNELADEL